MSGCGRSDRRLTCLVLLAILVPALAVCALSGCNALGEKGRRISLYSPMEIKCFVENPTQAITAVEEQPNFSYRSITITGLKNQRLEERINNKLKASFQAAKARGVPPYRGIRVHIPEGSTIMSEDISMYVSGSFNSVLSVVLSVHASYARLDERGTAVNPEQSVCYYGYTDSLNFDLTTGEEVSLRDVFTDDVTYSDLLDAAVSRKLQEGHATEEGWYFDMELGHLKLVKPFEGLAADQCFFLTESGLMLVFDYRTPQFETNLQAAIMRVPWAEFSDNVAITQRFYDDAVNLYTSEAPQVKTLLTSNDGADMPEGDYEKVGRVNVHTRVVNSTSFPATVQDKIRALAQRDENEIQRLHRAMEAVPQAFIEHNGEAYYDLNVSAYSAGRFVSVVQSAYSSIPSPDFDNSRQQVEHHCYDRKTGQEVLFWDIFVAGYDPAPVVKTAIRDTITSILSYGNGQQLSQQARDQLLGDGNIDRLYQSIQGVALSAGEVNLSVPSIVIGDQHHPVVLSIPYRDIGSVNLLIFE